MRGGGDAQEALERARELVARVLLERVERVAEPRLAHDLQRAAVRPLEDVNFFRAALELRGDRVSELVRLVSFLLGRGWR